LNVDAANVFAKACFEAIAGCRNLEEGKYLRNERECGLKVTFNYGAREDERF
jgi:hypothetical protein